MAKRLSRILIVTGFSLFLLGFVAANLLLLWVATGPRSLNDLTPYIEKAVAHPEGRYTARIGATWLQWGGWSNPIDIQTRDVKIITHDGETFASFPSVSLGIDFWSLPLGQVLPTSITLQKPSVNLFQNEDRSITFGFGEFTPPEPDPAEQPEIAPVEQAVPPMVPVEAFLSIFGSGSNSGMRKLERFDVHHAKVTLGNLKRRVFLAVTDVEFSAVRNRKDGLYLTAAGDLRYKKHTTPIGVEVFLGQKQPTVEIGLQFERLVPGTLSSLMADSPVVKIYNAPLTGSVRATVGKGGEIEQLLFNITGGGGYIDSDFFTNSLAVNTLHTEGRISNNGKDIQIDALSLQMDKTLINATGVAVLDETSVSAVRADITAQNVEAKDLGSYWPPTVSPLSREWVTTNITEGHVPEAKVSLNIQPGDLDKPLLPKEAVDATITVKDATIRYLPEHPPVTHVQAAVFIDGVGLSADIASAEYLQATRLSSGKLLIEDLNADNPYIKVSLDAATTAKEAVHFLKLPRLEHAKRLGLSPDTADGAATVHADVGFYFFAPRDEAGNSTDEPDIDYDVAGDIKSFSAPGFLDKFDIKNGNGKITINNKELTFKGTANVNGAEVTASDISYLFTPESGYDTFIDVTASAPISALKRFGYPQFPFLNGSLGVKAKVKQGENAESSTATIDLTQTAIDMPELSISKAAGQAASFEIVAEKQEAGLTIPSFKLSGPGMDASGSAMLSKDFSMVSKLSLQKTRLGNTDLQYLTYENVDNRMVIDVAGQSLDLRGVFDSDGEEKKSSEFSFEKFPALQFKSDLGQLMLSKESGIRDFKGEMRCTPIHCEQANVTGIVGEGKAFNFRILRNPKGKRQMFLRAYDFGAFLKAFAIYPNIEGGDLSLTGNYDDTATDSVLTGRLIVDNYTIRKAPILAKILSLTSLTGVIDVLQGKGITFTKLVSLYSLHDDVLTLSKLKGYGSSIGITANGTVQFPERMIDVSGTVVPAYVVNSILDKVPIVGKLLTGGGEGVFAFDYRVKGIGDDADVKVNPLSILKPGFLRGMFEGVDTEKPVEPPKE